MKKICSRCGIDKWCDYFEDDYAFCFKCYQIKQYEDLILEDIMTNETILKKALEKTQKNGFEWNPVGRREDSVVIEHNIATGMYKLIIFSHDFAKAFWGEIKGCPQCEAGWSGRGRCYGSCESNIVWQPAWEFHLQQMVLEKQPLKYIERFLKEDK